MGKIVMAAMVLLLSAGIVFGERVRAQFPKSFKNVKLAAYALDFEIRNISAPKYIYCTDPFLTVSVEVWNIGNMDYNPALGQAVLYCDLHDAATNAAIRFFDIPMDQVIKAGQFQKWTISSSRQQRDSQFQKNFAAAKYLQMMFCADEQGLTHDRNWTNNYKESRKVNTQCAGIGLLPITR